MSKTKLSKEGSLSCQTNRMTSFSGNEVCNNAINNLLSTFQMAELFSIWCMCFIVNSVAVYSCWLCCKLQFIQQYFSVNFSLLTCWWTLQLLLYSAITYSCGTNDTDSLCDAIITKYCRPIMPQHLHSRITVTWKVIWEQKLQHFRWGEFLRIFAHSTVLFFILDHVWLSTLRTLYTTARRRFFHQNLGHVQENWDVC